MLIMIKTSVIMTKNEYGTVLVALTILLIDMLICLHIRMSNKRQALANRMKSAPYIMLFLTQTFAHLTLAL